MAGRGKKFVKAAWDYTANEEEELTFKVGDIIEVTAEDPSGWWTGTVNGNSGTFPNNFVEPYTPPAKKGPPPVAPRPSVRPSPAASDAASASPAAASAGGPSRAAPPPAGGGGGGGAPDPMAELRAKLAKRSTMAPAEGSAAPAAGPSRTVPSGRTPGRATMAPAPSSDAPASPFGPGMLKRAGTRAPPSTGAAPAEDALASLTRPKGRSNTISTGAAPGNVAKLKGMNIPLGGAGPPPVAARSSRPAHAGGAPSPSPSGGAPSPSGGASSPAGGAPSAAARRPPPASRAAKAPAPGPAGAPAPAAAARASVAPAPRGTAAGGMKAPAPAPAPRAGARAAPAPTPAAPATATEATNDAKMARGTFAYTAEGDGELSFAEGDMITIIEQDDSGWWQGELNGTIGWFPASFAVEVEAEPKGPTIAERLQEATSDVKLLESTKRITRTGRRPPTRRKKAGTAVKSMKTETSDAPADLTGRETIINIGGALAAQLKAAGAAAKMAGPSGPTIPKGPQPEVNASAFPKLRKSGATSPSPSGPTRAAKADSETVDFRKNLRRTAAPRIQGTATADAAPSPSWAKKAPADSAAEGLAKLAPASTPERGLSAEAKAPQAAPPPAAPLSSAPAAGAPAAAAPTAAATKVAPSPAKAPGRGRGRGAKTGAGKVAARAPSPQADTPSLPANLGDYEAFVAAMVELQKSAKGHRGGKVSSHPVHSKAKASLFGVSVCTVDGIVHSLGASDVGFALGAACHPLLYALSLDDDNVKPATVVGNKPVKDGNPFDLPGNKAPNPLAAIGALALASELSKTDEPYQQSYKLFNGLSKLAGSPIGCDMAVFLAGTGDQAAIAAQAHWMASKDIVADPAAALNLYQQAYSGLVTCESLASIAATLANGGVCPKSSEQVVSSDTASKVTAVMKSCTMGTNSPTISLAGHGGDAGGLLVVVPGVCGLAVYSPPLNDEGISSRGVEFTNAFQAKFGL